MFTLKLCTPKTTATAAYAAPVIAERNLTLDAWQNTNRADMLTRFIRFVTFKR